MFLNSVKDPGFQKKLLVSIDIQVPSFVLKTPTTDDMLMSVGHIKDSHKYSKFLTLPQVCILIGNNLNGSINFRHTPIAVVQAGQTRQRLQSFLDPRDSKLRCQRRSPLCLRRRQVAKRKGNNSISAFKSEAKCEVFQAT
jgi:hypothetical protein